MSQDNVFIRCLGSGLYADEIVVISECLVTNTQTVNNRVVSSVSYIIAVITVFVFLFVLLI